jgi:regulator of replication initiation timing
MDIITTVGNSIALASRLREISKNIENAEFKNLLADLSLELADFKAQLADVIEENIQLKEQVRQLKSVDADPCPKCRARAWELERSEPHKSMGDLGVIIRHYKCSVCGFTEQKTVTP